MVDHTIADVIRMLSNRHDITKKVKTDTSICNLSILSKNIKLFYEKKYKQYYAHETFTTKLQPTFESIFLLQFFFRDSQFVVVAGTKA